MHMRLSISFSLKRLLTRDMAESIITENKNPGPPDDSGVNLEPSGQGARPLNHL